MCVVRLVQKDVEQEVGITFQKVCVLRKWIELVFALGSKIHTQVPTVHNLVGW